MHNFNPISKPIKIKGKNTTDKLINIFDNCTVNIDFIAIIFLSEQKVTK